MSEYSERKNIQQPGKSIESSEMAALVFLRVLPLLTTSPYLTFTIAEDLYFKPYLEALGRRSRRSPSPVLYYRMVRSRHGSHLHHIPVDLVHGHCESSCGPSMENYCRSLRLISSRTSLQYCAYALGSSRNESPKFN